MKILRKIVLYSLATLLLLVIGLLVSVYVFKDRIIQQFIAEANKNLGTPVKVGSIEVSAFQKFPQLAIVLRDVYVEDSHPEEFPLLTAKQVSFTLNPIEVWQGNYTIQGLEMTDSETNLRLNKAGVNNYTIVKKGEGGGGAVSFDLEDVQLKNTFVSYVDLEDDQEHEFTSKQLNAGIEAEEDQYHITAKGDVTTEQIGIRKSIYFKGKVFDLDATLDYDDIGKSIQFIPSKLLMNKSEFEVSGSYSFKEKNEIDLKAEGRDTDIRTLLSFLPESAAARLRKYQSKGAVYFNLGLKGEISERNAPFLSVAFGLTGVTLYHPDSQTHVDSVNLEGSFASPGLSKPQHAELFLRNISGRLNGDPFTGNFVLQDFEDPYVTADFQGELNAAALLNFYPIKEIQDLSGRVKADVSIRGQIKLLKSKITAQQVHTEGTMELKDIDFLIGEGKHHFAKVNGALQFNNNDLAMSGLSGKFERTDFLLNGFFKNIVTFLIFEDQPIGIEADLKSDFLDVDHLFAIGFGSEQQGPYKFAISRNLNLNFNYDIKSLKYREFHPTSVKGDLLVKGQVAVSRNIDLRAMGGSIHLNAIVDAKNPKAIDLISSAKLDGISIDSLFFVFDNFKQHWLDYSHLKGKATADISMEATLEESLRILPETLIADVSVTIKDGQLNNFQPMQQLSKYLDDEGLSRLRFGDLKNDIHIENKMVYVPQMEIRTNVTTLQLSGTHGFDQKIDYRVVAPLRNKKKIDPDESFGAVEQDLSGRSKVFLKIIGTTESYEVKYDKEAVRKKIGADIKKEVQDLKEALRLKGKKKKKELELEKDAYFDWEDQ